MIHPSYVELMKVVNDGVIADKNQVVDNNTLIDHQVGSQLSQLWNHTLDIECTLLWVEARREIVKTDTSKPC